MRYAQKMICLLVLIVILVGIGRNALQRRLRPAIVAYVAGALLGLVGITLGAILGSGGGGGCTMSASTDPSSSCNSTRVGTANFVTSSASTHPISLRLTGAAASLSPLTITTNRSPSCASNTTSGNTAGTGGCWASGVWRPEDFRRLIGTPDRLRAASRREREEIKSRPSGTNTRPGRAGSGAALGLIGGSGAAVHRWLTSVTAAWHDTNTCSTPGG